MFFNFQNTKRLLWIFAILFSVPSLAEDCTTRRASHTMIVQLLSAIYTASFIRQEEAIFQGGRYRYLDQDRRYRAMTYRFNNGLFCTIRPNGIGDSGEFYIAKVDCYDSQTTNGVESFDIAFVRSWPWSDCELGYVRKEFGHHVTEIL